MDLDSEPPVTPSLDALLAYPRVHTNARLTPEESSALKERMDQELTRMQNLALEEIRLTDLLRETRRSVTQSRTLLANMRSLFSWIRLLPEEILAEVFKFYCITHEPNWIVDVSTQIFSDNIIGEVTSPLRTYGHNGSHAEQGYISETRIPALTLSAVCSHWRRVATSIPSLWSSVQFGHRWWVDVEDHGIDAHNHLAKLSKGKMHVVLKRLKVDDYDSDTLQQLFRHYRNWRSLAVMFGFVYRHLLLDLHRAMRQVEPGNQMGARFVWENLEELTWDYAMTAGELFKVAPQLRKVAVSSPQAGGALQAMKLPWAQIESLTLREVDLTKEALEFIGKFTNMRQLSLFRCWKTGQTNEAHHLRVATAKRALTGAPLIIPPTLVELEIVFSGSFPLEVVAFHRLLQSCSIPSLKSLDIRTPHESYQFCLPFPSEALQKFLDPCKLTSLTLKKVLINEEGLLHLFEKLDALSSFTFQDVERFTDSRIPLIDATAVTDLVLARLTPSFSSDASPVLLPSLIKLNLTLRGDGFSDRTLADMIVERNGSHNPGVSRLASVNLSFTAHRFSSPIFALFLLSLRRAGKLLLEIEDVDGCLLTRLYNLWLDENDG